MNIEGFVLPLITIGKKGDRWYTSHRPFNLFLPKGHQIVQDAGHSSEHLDGKAIVGHGEIEGFVVCINEGFKGESSIHRGMIYYDILLYILCPDAPCMQYLPTLGHFGGKCR